jgi:signal transduction histidine kinase
VWAVGLVRITRKVGLLVAVPLAAALLFAGLAVWTTAGTATRAEELRRLVAAGAAAGELVHQLQAERAAGVLVLTGGTEHAELFAQRVGATDRAAVAFVRARDELGGLPGGTAGLVGRIEDQLDRLEGLRARVTEGGGRASAVAFSYRISTAALISFRGSVGQAGGAPAEVADHLRAAAALSQAGESVGLLQVAVLRAAGHGVVSPAAVQEITAARTGRLQALRDLDAFATPGWQAALEQAQVGPEALVAQELADSVARTAAGQRLRLDAAEWEQVTSGRVDRLRDVEAVVDADIQAEVTALRDQQRRLAAAQVLVVLVTVAAAVTVAVWLGRPVVARLRQLRDAAHQVAHQVLPQAVLRLETEQEQLEGLSPEEFADRTAVAVPVRGRDELAEVAAAFNAVLREAVRIAAGQALLRLRVGQMFVALARRGQGLAGQLTAAMDDLERDEQDTTRLTQLFGVDHLVTLLGRSNDALLVLGGAVSTRMPPSDAPPLAGVLQAAASRVRGYQRVQVGLVDEGVSLQAAAVDDVVLLLAELIDNAVRFSDPQTVVTVSARWLRNRVIVQVADDGVGTSPQRRTELNARLARDPVLDVQAVKQMGLTVVSRLAQRHQIRVQLHPAEPQGTTVEVELPARLVSAGPGPGRSAVAGRARLPGQPAPPAGASAMVPAPPAVSGGRPALSWPPQLAGTATAAPGGGGVAAWPVAGYLPAGQRPGVQPQPQPEREPPIFEQLMRSRWFTPATGPPTAAEGTGSWYGPGAGGGVWETTADAGWQAAAAAAAPKPAGATAGGLPVRRPGAQLVPGGVDQRPAPEARAAVPAPRTPDPDRVGAAARAFARGLQTGFGQRAQPVSSLGGREPARAGVYASMAHRPDGEGDPSR